MKLKKIASLALAGVMAVSMLAGCAGKTGTTENDGTKVEVTTSSIVSALNDEQEKVAFSNDTAFNAVAQKAVAKLSDVPFANVADSEEAVKTYVFTLTGKYFNIAERSANAFNTAPASKDAYSVLYVKAYTEAYWTESTVTKAAAADLAADLTKDKGLYDDNKKDDMKEGAEYIKYSYAGNATLITVNEMDGTTTYYLVAAVTRTGADATVANV